MKAQRILHSPLTAVAVVILTISIIAIFRTNALRSEHYFVRKTLISAQVASFHSIGPTKDPDKALVGLGYTVERWHGSRFRAFLSKTGETLGLLHDNSQSIEPSAELIEIELPANATPGIAGARISRIPSVYYSMLGTELVSHDGKLYVMYPPESADALDAEEDGEQSSRKAYPGKHGERFEGDRFVEMSPDDTRIVSEQIGTDSHNRFGGQDPGFRDQWLGWHVCTENPFASGTNNRCPVTSGESTWALKFNRTENDRLGGAMLVQLAGTGNRENIRLTTDSNGWVETDSTSEAIPQGPQGQQGKLFLAGPHQGTHFASGWTSWLMGLLVALGFPYVIMRTALSKSVNSNLYYPETRPEDFPGLDHRRLEYYSHFLLENGFTHIRDYTVASSTPSPNRPPTFARLFVNTELKCFAEVGQIFTKKMNMSGMGCNFMTAFNDDSRYCTTDRVCNPMMYIVRRQNRLWLSRPGMAIQELLSLHLQMVEQIKMRRAVTIIDDMSTEGYFLRSMQSVAEINKIILQKAVWLFPLVFELQYQKHRRHYEWLGNSGVRAPTTPWTPPAEEAENASSPRWQRTVSNWSPTISIASTVMLGFSTFQMLFHPADNGNVLSYRVVLLILGLAGYGLVRITKKRTENR